MDQNIIPDPEHSKFIWWIIGILSTLAGAFGLKWLNRQEVESDKNERKLDDHIENQTEHLTQFERRLTTLENAGVTRTYVDTKVAGVVGEFHADHRMLIEDLTAKIIQSEVRQIKATAQCNQALHSEMNLMQKSNESRAKEHSALLRDLLNMVKSKRIQSRSEDRHSSKRKSK